MVYDRDILESKTVQDEARTWLRRLSSGAATQDDVEALERWRSQDPAHARAFAEAALLWDLAGEAAGLAVGQYPELARQTNPNANSRLARRAFIGGAAALAASLGGFNSLVLTAPGAPAAAVTGATQSAYGFVTFSGNTVLRLPNQLVINAGTILVPNGATEMLSANYVQWNNTISSEVLHVNSISSTANNVAIGTGLQSFAVQAQPGLFVPGQTVTLTDSGNSANGMTGTVTSYNATTGALVVRVTSTTGSGTPQNGWTIVPFGTGTLTIAANTVDLIGNLAVQGANLTKFNVAGDLRLTGLPGVTTAIGSLTSLQELDFAAGQIYPTTETTFTLASATKISFSANGAPPLAPLSAGGVLNVWAPEIDQSGTLRAPTGVINLGSSTAQSGLPLTAPLTIPATTTLDLGAGSLTSVAADDETTLFGNVVNGSSGNVVNGTSWYYNNALVTSATAGQSTAGTLTISLPAKQINLSGRTFPLPAAPGSTVRAAEICSPASSFRGPAAQRIFSSARTNISRPVLPSMRSFLAIPASRPTIRR